MARFELAMNLSQIAVQSHFNRLQKILLNHRLAYNRLPLRLQDSNSLKYPFISGYCRTGGQEFWINKGKFGSLSFSLLADPHH